MNKYIKHNLKIYKQFEKRIREDSFDWYGIVSHFKCVSCGGYATFINFCFYDKDPKRVKCYKCQNKD